jgi:DNA-binding CsgD family transcriptional regulator
MSGLHSNNQVAVMLYPSEKTVTNTRTRVYAELGVRSRTQLSRLRF